MGIALKSDYSSDFNAQPILRTVFDPMRILVIDQAPRSEKSQPYDVAAIEKLLNSYASPGTKVEIGFPDDFAGANVFLTIGAQSALNGLHHMMETPAIVRKIFWAAQNGYDAVISSNTFEPGVDGGRLAVEIPVIGLMRTAMHAAATLADRIGVTVPLPPHVPYTWRLLRTHGLDRFVSDIRPIGIYGADIARRKTEIFDITVKIIRALVAETRAEIIVPLGGAIIPYVVDPKDLAQASGVQVLNTKAIGIRFAEMCVACRMTQSALTYPRAKLSYDDFLK
jgi:Asp/Glu/hydantoin racemase